VDGVSLSSPIFVVIKRFIPTVMGNDSKNRIQNIGKMDKDVEIVLSSYARGVYICLFVEWDTGCLCLSVSTCSDVLWCLSGRNYLLCVVFLFFNFRSMFFQ
jgi:hypothetical protein